MRHPRKVNEYEENELSMNSSEQPSEPSSRSSNSTPSNVASRGSLYEREPSTRARRANYKIFMVNTICIKKIIMEFRDA